MHKLAVEGIDGSEHAAAEQREVAHDSVEYGLHIRWQARNDAQYLCGGPLLPQRLGEFPRARLELLLKLARVRLELLFRCRLRFLRPAEMTHAGRPKLRIRRSSKHSTPGRPLCETVHAAGPNDGANYQVKITSLPNGLIGGTSCPRRRSHQTLTRLQGDPEPKRSFGSIYSICLSALVTDRAIKAWYRPSIA